MEDNFALAWDDDSSVAVVQEEGHVVEEVICDIENEILPGDGNDDFVAEEVCGEEQHSGGEDDAVSTNDVTPEEIIEENEQVDHEDIVYLTHDNVVVMQSVGQSAATVAYPEQVAFQEQTFQEHFMEECQVSEEVVTDHWDQSCPEEIIVGSEQAVGGSEEQPNEDFDIPLPTDQDEYTASRPYPCDFCSRRFRKKANLMNHMVAHQTDRPHGCNLCGASYIRKSDLMNHLKIHAYVPETDGLDEEDVLPLDESDVERMPTPRRNKPSKRTKKSRTVKEEIVNSYEVDDAAASGSRSYNYVDEDMRLMEAMENTKEYAEYTEYMEESQPMELRYPITDPKKPFVCQHCGVGFAREKALASHARVHGGDSPFECQKCGEMFWDISQMREHVRQKHGGDVEGDLDDGGEDEDEDYSEGEESTKYGTFYCSTCGLSFHRQDNLKRHLRIHVKDEFVNDHEFGHVCNVCGGSFPEALDLLAHAEIHTRTSEHRCMICGEVCPDDQALPMHVKTKHGKNLPPNTCLLCGRACKDRRTLLKHSWEHSKEKTFACSKCAKTFHNKARLKRHMLSHRNKVVACDVCGEEFPDGRTLMNHRHSHSSLSGRQFPCRECGKTFGSRSSQQIHIRIHTGERPYGCRFCWKAFADGGTLRKHERIHTGEKPYACAVCPRAFNQRVVLREHIRSHHSGPDPKYTHSVTPYCCQVCSDMFATSQDLIIHLIHHCDLNTAMKRQPQVGPRKYKRRRKLKPHELEMISNKADDEIEEEEEEHIYYESDSDREYQHRKKQSPVAAPVPKKAKKNSSSPKPSLNDTYTELYNSCSSALENINAIVNSKSSSAGKSKRKTNKTDPPVPSRPKMIHTQKTRVPVESSEDGRVRHKTRTLVTRTQPAELRSAIGERIRPRTKNVSYHILTGKPSVATFPDDATEQAVNNLLREESILNDSAAESVGEQLRQEDEEQQRQQQYHRKQVAEKQERHDAQQQPQSNGQVYTDQHHHHTNDRHPSPAASVPEVASEQIVETADDSAGPVPTNIIRITSAPTPLHNLRPGRHLIGPGGKLVRLVKGGMIIAKHKDKKAIEPEKILPDVGNAASRSTAAANDDATTTIINRANPEPVNIKQEIVEASPLHELAELSMQHAQNMFKCEMCSAVFSDRAKLLDHVSIHI